jgi:hypothetical protein
MATTTVPEIANAPAVTKTAPISLTPNAVAKVKEIMGQQRLPVCALAWSAAAVPASPIPCSSRMAPA